MRCRRRVEGMSEVTAELAVASGDSSADGAGSSPQAASDSSRTAPAAPEPSRVRMRWVRTRVPLHQGLRSAVKRTVRT